ncbi:hypothetical protein EI555_017618 [Monodon monoceros]|uniref:RING-type E3 ubiquitin transferase n=1 Tax=Monodon monoceros TaxID=40151 RepID=A0A4U1EHA7_MONMO|nr:hypothetical protein EI555_017618 [Monodon monoceros]
MVKVGGNLKGNWSPPGQWGSQPFVLHLGTKQAAALITPLWAEVFGLSLITEPFHSISSFSGFKCPICSKSVASDEMEMHFIMCLSKPRLSYNGTWFVSPGDPFGGVGKGAALQSAESSILCFLQWAALNPGPLKDERELGGPGPLSADDVLTKDAGECVICLEELLQGDTIARLPCLCIYHKRMRKRAERKQLHRERP